MNPRTILAVATMACLSTACRGGAPPPTATAGWGSFECHLAEPVPDVSSNGCLGDSWQDDDGCPLPPDQLAACVSDCQDSIVGQEHLDCHGDCSAIRVIPLDWFHPAPWTIGALLARPPGSGDFEVQGYVAKEGIPSDVKAEAVLAAYLPGTYGEDGVLVYEPLPPDAEYLVIRSLDASCYHHGQPVNWFLTKHGDGSYTRMRWSKEQGWYRSP